MLPTFSLKKLAQDNIQDWSDEKKGKSAFMVINIHICLVGDENLIKWLLMHWLLFKPKSFHPNWV